MFNVSAIKELLDEAGLPFDIQSDGTLDPYPSPNAPTPAQTAQAQAIVAAHNPALLSVRQKGMTQLAAFLDSRVQDLKYGDYFYRLQKRLLDLWRDKPNLTDTTTEVVAALKANRASDVTHLQMWNVFCWKVNIDFAIPITPANGGSPYQELPVSPTAAQARQIVQCAYDFMNGGVQMLNMILLNQRG